MTTSKMITVWLDDAPSDAPATAHFIADPDTGLVRPKTNADAAWGGYAGRAMAQARRFFPGVSFSYLGSAKED